MAAGGFKTFTAGDVLTAADTNDYLMQGILVFADDTARDAAVTSPVEGQFCFLKDTDTTQVYDGTDWVEALFPISAEEERTMTRSQCWAHMYRYRDWPEDNPHDEVLDIPATPE